MKVITQNELSQSYAKNNDTSSIENHLLVPTSFKGTSTSFYTLSPSYQWSTLNTALSSKRGTVVLNMLPPFWQLEGLLYDICRKHGCAPFFVSPKNSTVTCAALSSLPAHTIIGPAHQLLDFAGQLTSLQYPLPKTWICIYSLDEPRVTLPSSIVEKGSEVYSEVHLFPGVPLLHQCPVLAGEKSDLFHLSRDYTWNITPEETCISTSSQGLGSFSNVQLSCILSQKIQCICGEPAFIRTL